MYPNLLAEMKRRNITMQNIADKLHRTVGTISLKFSGKYPLTFAEAVQVRNFVAPGMSLDVLFDTEAVTN